MAFWRASFVVAGLFLAPAAACSQQIALGFEAEDSTIPLPTPPVIEQQKLVPAPVEEPAEIGQPQTPKSPPRSPSETQTIAPSVGDEDSIDCIIEVPSPLPEVVGPWGEFAPHEAWMPPVFEPTLQPLPWEAPGAPSHCPWWRPCGPKDSFGRNWLFYQGAYGADFRPACQNHDDCLMNPYNSRYGCDRMLYEQMLASCADSTHPALCHWKAAKYYVGVRMFGGFVRHGAP